MCNPTIYKADKNTERQKAVKLNLTFKVNNFASC